jgi:hypothetical protein
MIERNAEVSPEKRIEFRMGINFGELIVDRPLSYADNLPMPAIEDLGKRAIKEFTVGGGHAQPECIVRPWHQLAPDLKPRSAREAFQKLTSAVSYGPNCAHGANPAPL